MAGHIWFEIADCVGEALAKRWLGYLASAIARRTAKSSTVNEAAAKTETGTSENASKAVRSMTRPAVRRFATESLELGKKFRGTNSHGITEPNEDGDGW